MNVVKPAHGLSFLRKPSIAEGYTDFACYNLITVKSFGRRHIANKRYLKRKIKFPDAFKIVFL